MAKDGAEKLILSKGS